MLIEARNLHVRFFVRKGLMQRTTIYAVNGVDIALEPGETVAVVGESGSGKTTLGRALLRLVKPAEGSITFDGRDITKLEDAKLRWFRRGAQAVFQDPYSSINPYMTILQIVQEPLDVHGVGDSRERGEKVRKALTDVGLRPPEVFLAKFPHTLSGGQRQRVGIARALVLEPKLIVADEPVSMIDASSRAEILYLMRDLQRQYAIAFLYITHDIASARHFADRVAVMYLGAIVEEGSPEAVIEQPLHPYTQALIEAVPEPDPANRLRERQTIPGEPPSPVTLLPGCPFHPRCPQYMPGLCNKVKPELKEPRPDHRVACLLYEEAGIRYQQDKAEGKLTGQEVAAVTMTNDDYKKKLTPEQYHVTREKGTERAFTGAYWDAHDKGVYRCICCDAPLFSSETKYESHTGWPSFWAPIEGAPVGEETDRSYGMSRTEVKCENCGAHLGHVFPDGPKPTGLRYCLNSESLRLEKKLE